MELANALYKIDMLLDDQGRVAEKEAWNFIRAYIAEVQKPAANSRYVTALHVYLQWCAEVRLDTVNNLLSYHTWLNERLKPEEPACT
jgi:hypothetical protein